LISVAVLCLALAFLAVALAEPNDAVTFLIAAALLAWLAGSAVAAFLRIEEAGRRHRVAISAALCAGLACSFFLIQFERRKEHPWPEHHGLYIATGIVRGGLLGVVVGFLVSAATVFITKQSRDLLRDRTTLLLGGLSFVLLCVWWQPVLPFYRQQWASDRLLASVKNARDDQVPSRVEAVKRHGAELDAVGRIAFQALYGRSDRVRLTALQALKLLCDARLFKPVLSQMQNDQSEVVRSAAADLWKTVSPAATTASE
jgi:hypothetical protein